jgi:hypothetical protein
VTRDLKIELHDLFGLHSASLELEHAVRQGHEGEWQAFSPSRFVYAFFTFNSIYAWNWEKSFRENKLVEWEQIVDPKTGRTRDMREYEQFLDLIAFYNNVLGDDTPRIVAKLVDKLLDLFGIVDAQDKLTRIDRTNEDGKMKNLREKFPKAFATICEATAPTQKHHQALRDALNFIYRVRCNIFHGSKRTIEMQNPEQQTRLLIYTSVLIATNGLLFEVAKSGGIGWVTPKLNWDKKEEPASVLV